MLKALILAAALAAALFMSAVLLGLLWSLLRHEPGEMVGIGAAAGGLSVRFVTTAAVLAAAVFVGALVMARNQQRRRRRGVGKRGRDV